ncbi:hypothetical protein [Microbacterium sp. SLBN-111]|uniref:hypothetical protein n=1 Tax=Microbacterium sp. SLBN-111 TaxID=3377733 RepID=UPI003C776D97
MQDEEGTTQERRGIPRRTIVTGAAWSVPVIALAVAAPAASASAPTGAQLEFLDGPYSVTACGTLSPVTVSLTAADGSPIAGQSVLITLPEGLTWSDGTTAPKAFVTDASGRASVTGIVAPAKNGTFNLTATSGSLSDVESVTVTGQQLLSQYWTNGGSTSTWGTLPDGSKVVGFHTYLTPDGQLWDANNLVASGVTSASAQFANTNGSLDDRVSYMQGGVAKFWSSGTGTLTFGSVPAGAVTVGDHLYLTPGGQLWNGNTLIASNVSSASGRYTVQNGNLLDNVTYVENGVAKFWRSDGVTATYGSVPTGATVVGQHVYLTPNGDLYNGNTLVASGVSSASAEVTVQNGEFYDNISFVDGSGQARYIRTSGSQPLNYTFIVPAGSKTVGFHTYLTPDGQLWDGNQLVAENVVDASAMFVNNGSQFNDALSFLQIKPC